MAEGSLSISFGFGGAVSTPLSERERERGGGGGGSIPDSGQRLFRPSAKEMCALRHCIQSSIAAILVFSFSLLY